MHMLVFLKKMEGGQRVAVRDRNGDLLETVNREVAIEFIDLMQSIKNPRLLRLQFYAGDGQRYCVNSVADFERLLSKEHGLIWNLVVEDQPQDEEHQIDGILAAGLFEV